MGKCYPTLKNSKHQASNIRRATNLQPPTRAMRQTHPQPFFWLGALSSLVLLDVWNLGAFSKHSPNCSSSTTTTVCLRGRPAPMVANFSPHIAKRDHTRRWAGAIDEQILFVIPLFALAQAEGGRKFSSRSCISTTSACSAVPLGTRLPIRPRRCSQAAMNWVRVSAPHPSSRSLLPLPASIRGLRATFFPPVHPATERRPISIRATDMFGGAAGLSPGPDDGLQPFVTSSS